MPQKNVNERISLGFAFWKNLSIKFDLLNSLSISLLVNSYYYVILLFSIQVNI